MDCWSSSRLCLPCNLRYRRLIFAQVVVMVMVMAPARTTFKPVLWVSVFAPGVLSLFQMTQAFGASSARPDLLIGKRSKPANRQTSTHTVFSVWLLQDLIELLLNLVAYMFLTSEIKDTQKIQVYIFLPHNKSSKFNLCRFIQKFILRARSLALWHTHF